MDQIEEVRSKVDIVDLISSYVTLKKSGRNFKANCPFHEEKTPSFMVSSERQIFKCFGCQEGGDVFKFLMRKEGLEFGEALRMLADRVGVTLKSFKADKGQQQKEKLVEINHLASEYFAYLLTEHKAGKKALEYLKNRGIRNESIKRFKLGFAPDEWEGLTKYLTRKKKYILEDVEKAGLAIKGNRGYYDRFRNRVMFALMDHRDRVVGFAGRVFDDSKSLPADRQEAKYVNSPETDIYHKSAVLYGLETTKEEIKRKDRAVVVEGELDAIASYEAGVKNVVAIKGSALTVEQIDLLKRFTENIALALDQDVAGDKAARRGIELAEQKGMNVRVIRLKYGKDPDECARKSARLWKDSVAEAVPVFDFYLDSAKERFGVDTPEGKRQISDEMAKALAVVTNEVVKAHYVKKTAELLEVGEEAVEAEVGKQARQWQNQKQEEGKKQAPQDKSRKQVMEEYLLALLLQKENLVEQLVVKVDEDWFGAGAIKKVMVAIIDWFVKKKKWEVNKFVDSLPEELRGVIDTAYLTDMSAWEKDEDRIVLEFDKACEKLAEITLKERVNELSQEIKMAESNKEKEKVKKLQGELVEVSKQIKMLGKT